MTAERQKSVAPGRNHERAEQRRALQLEDRHGLVEVRAGDRLDQELGAEHHRQRDPDPDDEHRLGQARERVREPLAVVSRRAGKNRKGGRDEERRNQRDRFENAEGGAEVAGLAVRRQHGHEDRDEPEVDDRQRDRDREGQDLAHHPAPLAGVECRSERRQPVHHDGGHRQDREHHRDLHSQERDEAGVEYDEQSDQHRRKHLDPELEAGHPPQPQVRRERDRVAPVEHIEQHAEAGEGCADHHLVRVVDGDREHDGEHDRHRRERDSHPEQVAHEAIARLALQHGVLAQSDARQAEIADARDDRRQRQDRHKPSAVHDAQVPDHQRGRDDGDERPGHMAGDPQDTAADHGRAGLTRVEDVDGRFGHRLRPARSSASRVSAAVRSHVNSRARFRARSAS